MSGFPSLCRSLVGLCPTHPFRIEPDTCSHPCAACKYSFQGAHRASELGQSRDEGCARSCRLANHHFHDLATDRRLVHNAHRRANSKAHLFAHRITHRLLNRKAHRLVIRIPNRQSADHWGTAATLPLLSRLSRGLGQPRPRQLFAMRAYLRATSLLKASMTAARLSLIAVQSGNSRFATVPLLPHGIRSAALSSGTTSLVAGPT